MEFEFSSRTLKKLHEKHAGVSQEEVRECFSSPLGKFLEDKRATHKTDPVTQWFIGETDYGKLLKVVFILFPGEKVVIKTAYPPNQDEMRIYTKYAMTDTDN